jgi:hypothetical protein
LLAQKKESGGSKCADRVQDYGIRDEIRKNHQARPQSMIFHKFMCLPQMKATKPIDPKTKSPIKVMEFVSNVPL